MESLRNRILTCLVERAPNTLTVENFQNLLGLLDLDILQAELDKMESEKLIIARRHSKKPDYMLKSYDGLPIRQFVSVGPLKVPRLLANDTARPEELNIYFEVLARRFLEIESEAEKKMDERLKSYWANIVTLFGAFIGVFALITGFLKTVPIEYGATFQSVLLLSTAQVLPLAVILGCFIWLLRFVFK